MGLAQQSQFTEITQANFDQIFANVRQDDVHGITLHWTVGLYDQLWDEYQFCIDGQGRMWMNNAGWDEQGQHLPLNHFSHGLAESDPLAQLWHRNTGNVGISWCAMYNATEPSSYDSNDIYTMPKSYGPCPPTKAQVDSMIWLSAKLLHHYKLGFDSVKSHYEWAVIDGYADERWDLRHEKPNMLPHIEQVYAETKPKG